MGASLGNFLEGYTSANAPSSREAVYVSDTTPDNNQDAHQLQKRIIKQSSQQPYQTKSFDKDEYFTYGFIRTLFEDKHHQIVPKALKDLIHRYTLFCSNMITFIGSGVMSTRDLIRYDMKKRGDVKHTASTYDGTEVICISCYGDMILKQNSSIIIPKNDNFKETKLQIYARDINLQSHICSNQIQISIMCRSLFLDDGCVVSGKNVNIHVINKFGFGKRTMIESAENMNVNIGGTVTGNANDDTLKLKSNMHYSMNEDEPAIRLNCNDNANDKNWTIKFECSNHYPKDQSTKIYKAVGINNQMFSGKEVILNNSNGRKCLMIDKLKEYPNLLLPNMEMREMMKYV